MNYERTQWENTIIQEIKAEATRLLSFINDYEQNGHKCSEYNNHYKSQINRATLDLNRVAVKLRKGWWQR